MLISFNSKLDKNLLILFGVIKNFIILIFYKHLEGVSEVFSNLALTTFFVHIIWRDDVLTAL